jgi:hypothetical protein
MRECVPYSLPRIGSGSLSGTCGSDAGGGPSKRISIREWNAEGGRLEYEPGGRRFLLSFRGRVGIVDGDAADGDEPLGNDLISTDLLGGRRAVFE